MKMTEAGQAAAARPVSLSDLRGFGEESPGSTGHGGG